MGRAVHHWRSCLALLGSLAALPWPSAWSGAGAPAEVVAQVEAACRSWGAPLSPLGLRKLQEGLAGSSSSVPSPPAVAWRLAQLQFFAAEEQCWPRVTEMCARRPEVFMDASVKKIWEEDGLLAIHKPWGMRVYLPRNDAGDRYRTWPGELTVHDWLKEMYPKQRTYMCNRLDFATSGLMLVALNQQAAKHASALFRKREVHKFYQALVLGHPPATWDPNGARLCDRLRDVPGRFARSVAPSGEGQTAETTVKVLQRGQWPKDPPYEGGCSEGGTETKLSRLEASLVQVEPKTGRRHQIRVHLASSGHPILGDDAYGGQPWGKRWMCHRMLPS